MSERKLDPRALSLSGQMEFQIYQDFLNACPGLAYQQALLNFQDYLAATTLLAMRETEIDQVKRQLHLAQQRNRELMALLAGASSDTRLGEFVIEEATDDE